jgi:hypothetical protein
MDPECSICCAINESLERMNMICRHIDFACQGKSEKSDFGLYKSFAQRIVSDLQKMQEYHTYYHATGKSLKDSITPINYEQRPFKRFRPSS